MRRCRGLASAEIRHALLWVAVGLVRMLVVPEGPKASVRVLGRKSPGLCPVLRVTGHRCPGCGMTRGVLYMLRLDLRNAMRANPLAPAGALMIAHAALFRASPAAGLATRPGP